MIPTELEEIIRKGFKTGMTDKILMNIQYVSGFEKFGTYENWGQGFIVSGSGMTDLDIEAQGKELRPTIAHWFRRHEAAIDMIAGGATHEVAQAQLWRIK